MAILPNVMTSAMTRLTVIMRPTGACVPAPACAPVITAL